MYGYFLKYKRFSQVDGSRTSYFEITRSKLLVTGKLLIKKTILMGSLFLKKILEIGRPGPCEGVLNMVY